MKIYDIETYIDSTIIVFKEVGGKLYDVFVDSHLDYSNLRIPKCTIYPLKDVGNYVAKDPKLIGFNNQYFDNPILEKIIRGMISSEDIYKYSQGIINSKNRFYLDFRDNHLHFKYLDLLKINHYDNPARATSLKKLEFNYRKKRIADLPFGHETKLTKLVQLEDLIRYCCYDVDVTEDCFINSKEAISLRETLCSIYSGTNFMNLSNSKIGEELNLKDYCASTGRSPSEVKESKKIDANIEIAFKDCIPTLVQFKTEQLQKFLESLKSKVVRSTKEFKEKIEFHGTIYTFGQGGLHSEDPARIFRSSDKMILKDADISGQYPTEIIKRGLYPKHLSVEWSKNAEKKYLERINVHKPNSKTDPKAKAQSDAIKEQLNAGLYGKTNSEYSWQYDPVVTMKTTLGCQTTMMMLIEDLELNNIHVVSVNTDGIVCFFERSKLDTYYDILEKWKEKVGNSTLGDFEFTDYELLAQLSVNDYIAKSTKGEIKRKGSFLTYEDIKSGMWHKDSSGMIIPTALEKYFINGVPVEDTINNCNDIFEFCYGSKKQKAAKKGNFKWLISETQESGIISSYLSEDRFIRYYMGGKSTINKLYEDWEIKNLPTKGNPVTVAQYLKRSEIIRPGETNSPYKDLNKNFYIQEALEIIKTIENEKFY